METPLAERHCRPLPRGTAPVGGPALDLLLGRLDAGWRVVSGPLLARRFASPDYPRLVALAARIGALAQAEDHHPDLALGYGALDVAVSTHSIGGLSENDFILAAKIDLLARETSF